MVPNSKYQNKKNRMHTQCACNLVMVNTSAVGYGILWQVPEVHGGLSCGGIWMGETLGNHTFEELNMESLSFFSVEPSSSSSLCSLCQPLTSCLASCIYQKCFSLSGNTSTWPCREEAVEETYTQVSFWTSSCETEVETSKDSPGLVKWFRELLSGCCPSTLGFFQLFLKKF